MTRRQFLLRSLGHYWRTHVAVVAGVAVAVAVLAGALVVGDSVRGTLRELALSRLGATARVVLSGGFFREGLAGELSRAPGLEAAGRRVTPLVVREGLVTAQASGARVGRVQVYGVDDRFWAFHQVPGVSGPDDRSAFISEALAAETGLEPGAALLVRVERPSDVPLESLHANRDDVGRTLRLTVGAVLSPGQLGDFSLGATQGTVRAVFVPLDRLQETLEIEQRVNALLVSDAVASRDTTGGLEPVAAALRRHATLADLGVRVRPLEGREAFAVESDAGVLDSRVAEAAIRTAESAGLSAQPAFTYLVNTIRSETREIPYSLVTGIELAGIGAAADGPAGSLPAGTDSLPIVLNDWAARDLAADVGTPITLEFFVWEEPGRLETHSAAFRVVGVVPTRSLDRDFAPRYRGITDSATLATWDPPFPIDLRRVRPADEEYWETYRTTPKAYIPLETAQELWRSRYGALTSVRVATPDAGPDRVAAIFAEQLQQALDPLALGMAVTDVRGAALTASRGATNFGEYFIYFSFFLVVSALSLAALFFRLGIEQRAQEIGLLRAVGFAPSEVRRLLLAEAVVVAIAGAVVGVVGAVGYGWLLVTALGTHWFDAVRTTAITLHVSPISLVGGALAAVAAALVSTWWTLRGLGRISERRLLLDRSLSGPMGRPMGGSHRRPLVGFGLATAAGLLLIAAGLAGLLAEAGAFFGAGSALLIAGLFGCAYLYRRPPSRVLHGRGWVALAWLGLRNAADRPGRSLTAIAVIGSAAFILISVDAFRRDAEVSTTLPPGVGGYRLMAESVLPIVHDPGSEAGREALNLSGLEDTIFEPVRLRPGDDASCLNLYQPQNPRILGVRDTFIARGGFAFRDSLAATASERANPWRLLERTEPDAAVPVIADANSLAYVLHRAVGDELVIETGGDPIRLRIVAALADSLFQSELIMAEEAFVRVFGQQAGYRVLLIDTPAANAAATTEAVEDALTDFGMDVSSTAARLAEYHQVENTYLSTFQTLGGLGLLLGTLGLAAVVLRNVLERRRELALLRAVGYEPRDFLLMLLSETGSLLFAGLVVGASGAALAMVPAVLDRGGRFPISAAVLLLLSVVGAAGVTATWLAARGATSGALLQSLKSE